MQLSDWLATPPVMARPNLPPWMLHRMGGVPQQALPQGLPPQAQGQPFQGGLGQMLGGAGFAPQQYADRQQLAQRY
jgi:hypothetical protein